MFLNSLHSVRSVKGDLQIALHHHISMGRHSTIISMRLDDVIYNNETVNIRPHRSGSINRISLHLKNVCEKKGVRLHEYKNNE